MENLELETKNSVDTTRVVSTTIQKKVFIRTLIAGSIVLGATTGCTSVVAEKEKEEVQENPGQNQPYYDEEIEQEYGFDEEVEQPFGESEFVFPEHDSTLDSEGFPEEGYVESEIGVGRVSIPDTPVENQEKGLKVQEKEAEAELIVEEDSQWGEIQEIIRGDTREILSLKQELSFDERGNLYFENDEGEMVPVLMFETERHLTHPYEPLNDVKFFIIHYDAGPLTLASGAYRTVFNTLNGLNREAKPSVQFCVDPYPITNEVVENEGLGVILSQRPNSIPYKGRHVQVGINLETGAEDQNRIKTANIYEELGVGSRFVDFVNSGNRDFDSYSLGVEQVGTKFATNFPDQFPPNQQIANLLALSEAVASRYDLSVWDIVGHHQVQEKSDPGAKFMLTLRYLLGLSYQANPDKYPENFLEAENLHDYLSTLREYAMINLGEDRYERWNNIYEMDEVLETLQSSESVINEGDESFLAMMK